MKIRKSVFSLIRPRVPRSLDSESRQEGFLDSLSLQGLVGNALQSSTGLSVIRPGGVESNVLKYFLENRAARDFRTFHEYPPKLRESAFQNAGICQTTEESLDEFALHFYGSLIRASVMVTFPWTEWTLGLKRSSPKLAINYDSFDPILAFASTGSSWLSTFAGKKVLVISPFSKSMTKQLERSQTVTVMNKVWPSCEIQFLSPPLTFAGYTAEKSWFESFKTTALEMARTEFDIALIGAGSYGANLADEAKSLGRIGIHLGGGLQLLFGIMGKRWEGYEVLQHFGPLQNWVRPLPEERPPRAEDVDHGAYW